MNNPYILTVDSTIKDLIRALDENGNGFLAVVDHQNRLQGIITDGDIRRAILNDVKEVHEVINSSPVTMPASSTRSEVEARLKILHRRHMPLIDQDGKLSKVIILDDFDIPSRGNYVVIMAGGLGSRLGELTKETPKPMLHVGGKPILEGIIDTFKEQGFKRFILSVNYKSHVIEEYFGNGKNFGVEIQYTQEKKRLGTAGALSLIDRSFIENPFFVINGDVLTSIDYEEMMDCHNNEKAIATMCLKKFSYQVPYACIEFDDQQNLLRLEEKPNKDYFINAGIYVLSPGALNHIPKDTFYDMPTLFEELIASNKVVKIFNNDHYWLDIGQPSDFKKAQKDTQFGA
ncbi:nucleotidyltransferase family protein [Ekhidna sp.]|uniref:nucleotidyltransferase family protein n=1 Tax=Ekhidna sp. TaxID=2608089 RepID=UPI00329A2DEC